MDNVWSLQTHGDPLGAVRNFIARIWLEADLDGMLMTMTSYGDSKATPRYITEVERIHEFNPFNPLMEINAARVIPGLLADHPDEKVGALLRPCELRALIEMTKHSSLTIDNLLTISVDCLGTFPAAEYQWRLERMGKNLAGDETRLAESSDELAQEALKFARQGGIVPYRYRSACQVCTSPAAEQADINISVLGLPVRQQMLVSVSDADLEPRYHIELFVDGIADQNQILQHKRIIAKLSERHNRTMERIEEGLGGVLPADVDAVIFQLESCGECQNCLDVCPICSVDRPERSASGHYDRADVMRWLVSCAGCGMCEQSCPNHLPISSIFAHIRKQLDEEWEYLPGRSIDDILPFI